ncbi:Pyruvate dehydrogenase acetyl-transferring kinase, mitochondrial [Hondaea fermentalgiana]|uniref:Protein-serine/threonine kinase n=1 Tax=Hondaea fermentalgiana TaxID=2315210 RepID=A0A2R5GWD6_9STRA|nr:Pyruvate dehydrogenase acetyl-transferring kinase, mitochondrial [Hondaea fermentalgiana]|eukprot:GBG34078.1 Pyruvate dehydrogenase acetyl-transferring kinase, mitochondrial [Hondaea fermentalgiana]
MAPVGLPLERRAEPGARVEMAGARTLSISGAKTSLIRRGSRDYSLEHYAKQQITPVTIQQMLLLSNSKQRQKLASALQNELLVRVAKRFNEMSELPPKLLETKPVQRVTMLYYTFFQDLAAMPAPNTEEREKNFNHLCQEFYMRDAATLPSIARGLRQFKRGPPPVSASTIKMLDAQLDDLFTARLSVRMLIGQQCGIAGRSKIKRGLCVAEVAREAAENTRALCLQRFGVCPEIQVKGHLDFKFTYVESHLHHMLFELLKNSVRAVIEQHRGAAGAARRKRLRLSADHHLGPDGLPPVLVAISGGREDVVIKVSDEGGGIPRSEMAKIWSYEYTTIPDEDVRSSEEANEAPVDSDEANIDASATVDEDEEPITFRSNFVGMGYGLPISRVFARYFGGDLKIMSTEGWGTDAYIYINRLESAAVETLPE